MIKNSFFNIFLLISTIYYLAIIFRSSFVIGADRYFVLFDDMMISMRYASNLANGNGLVWNQGERIEGFSNFLWTIYMSAIHLLPIPISYTSLFISLTGILCMIGILIFVKKIAQKITGGSSFVIWASLIFTAFYFPLISWATVRGTEVAPLALLVIIICYSLISFNKNIPLIFLLLFIGVLVRLDFMIFATIVIAYLFIFEQKKGKVVEGLFFFILGIMTYMLLRFEYYRDFLPNTYYLKATGYPLVMRVARGFYVLPNVMNELFMVIVIAGVFTGKNKYISFLFVVFVSQIAYSVFVGGDAWEFFGGANRYISVSMPIFFILLFFSMWKIGSYFKKNVIPTYITYPLILFFLIISFVSFNSRSDNMLLQFFLIRSVIPNEEGIVAVQKANALEKITKPNAKIAITTAGAIPYFLSNRKYIDMLGKSDKVIAHMEALLVQEEGLKSFLNYRPGHVKWDNSYSIGKLKPDVIVSLLAIDDKAEKYLEEDYRQVSYDDIFFYSRIKSKNIRWGILD